MPLTVLVALEQRVAQESKPLFIRAYAWYRLLRHWCSLRYSDAEGCSPQSLRTRARGVYGFLERTKTTGSDKDASVLPIFVSTEAHVEVEWLLVGLELWQQAKLSPTGATTFCAAKLRLLGHVR